MTRYNTYHEADDDAKLKNLTDSMIRHGWVGPPLVKWGEYDLITGAHRYTVARELGLDVPTVDLEDLFAEAGYDFETCWIMTGSPAWGDPAVVELVNMLPEAIRTAYGIDLH